MINPACIKYADEFSEDLLETLQPYEFNVSGYPVIPVCSIACTEIFTNFRLILDIDYTSKMYKSTNFLVHLLDLCKKARKERYYQGNFNLPLSQNSNYKIPGQSENEYNFLNQLVVYDLDNVWKCVDKLYYEAELDLHDVALIKNGKNYYIDASRYNNQESYLDALCELLSTPSCKVSWVEVTDGDEFIPKGIKSGIGL